MLNRSINKLLHLGKSQDLIEPAIYVLSLDSENGAVQVNVLATSQFRMKTGAHFQQRPHTAMDLREALRRLGDTRQNFQERALASPIPPDDANDFSTLDLKGYIFERPDKVV